MKRKIYIEKLLLSLTPELKNDLHNFCNKREIEVSSTIRKAIRIYIDDPDNMSNKEIIQKLKDGVKDEPIIEELEIPTEFEKEISEGMTLLKISIPTKLMNQIEFIIKKTNLNIHSFCAKSFRKYLVYLERR